MTSADQLVPGVEVAVDVGPVAHGGHCVARHDGRVIFVRHAIPGERVLARVTEGAPGDRFVRADAVRVLHPDARRVEPSCPVAGPGGCGGCDFQHVQIGHQRELKARVVAEQLRRLAGLDRDVVVEPLDDAGGLGYRTRVELAVTTGEGGDAPPFVGLRRHRSHAVVPISDCPIADAPVREGIAAAAADARAGGLDPGTVAVDVVGPSGEGDVLLLEVDDSGDAERVSVRERVEAAGESHELSVDARGFWQVHRDAPRAFVEAVLDAAGAGAGDRVLDLYSGVGLFTVPLAAAVGARGQVVAVESDPLATRHLEANLAGLDQAVALRGRVDDVLGVARSGRRQRGRRGAAPARSPLIPPSADVVVLDPPRTGAGGPVVRAIAQLGPRTVVYVACDPAALARDTAPLAEHGYRLDALRAFDAFPMTHHVECVATFQRG
ncbi:TRAM domain-containing protein [Marihabitans asiaticum]|uniref:23S rRNA m(5)U-1939 methyltransferase n=1 Tax=Marihabitans asiaticum TaxID=415218 RepID=A0A560W6U1_9MICO|nr:TRAM domain-containing protein [Marihabitans asiaticum]TWD13341.1 23S rRNA m(5)U-1939 methyltransferase [Marihabitans asiaticum]